MRLGLPSFAFREFAVSAALSTPLPEGKFLCEFVSQPVRDLLQQYCFRRPYMFHSMSVPEVAKFRAEVARLDNEVGGPTSLATRAVLQALVAPEEPGNPERSASWYGIREDSLVGFESSRRALREVDSFISIYCDRNHISEREEKARRSAALAHCEILRKMFGALDWGRKQKLFGAPLDPFRGGFEAVQPPVDSWKNPVESV
jgi:hypothetical protein